MASEPERTHSLFRLIRERFKPHWKWFGVGTLCAAITAFAAASYGYLLKLIVEGLEELARPDSSVVPSHLWWLIGIIGFAAAVIGVVLTSQYHIEHDLKMSPGDTDSLAGYDFRFVSVGEVRGPNYVADEAIFLVFRDGQEIAEMAPQKRRYLASGDVLTEAAIDAGVFRDLFVAMGEPIGSDGAWAIRLHYKPFVRWMWGGSILMALGGFLTVADKRYRRQRSAARDSNRQGAVHAAQT
jgi:cytochrome c-type biogenesis protein CcmF